MANQVIREYTLKLSTKEAQQALDKTTDSLKMQDDALIRIKEDLIKYETQLEKTSQKNWKGREKLNKLIKDTKTELKRETITRQALLKQRQRDNEALREAKKSAADFSGAMGVLDSATGGAASAMSGLVGGVGKATKGFGALKIAMMATGFGLILAAITGVTKALTSNEEGQGKLVKMMNRVKAVVETVTGALSNFGKTVLSVGKWLGAKFTGDTDKANEALGEMKDNWDKTTDSVNNFGETLEKNMQIADKMSAIQNKNSKLERELIIERGKANAEIAKLREIAADKENNSVQERIKALRDASALEDEVAQKELQLAQQRLQAHQLEMAMGEDSKEDLKKEAELIAAVSKIEQDSATRTRMLNRTINAAIKEEQAEIDANNKKIADDKKKADEDELQRVKDLADLKKQIRDAMVLTEEQERADELLKIQEHYDALILQAEENNIVTDELKAARDEALGMKQEEFDQQDLERKKKIADEEEKIEEQKRKSVMETFDNAARIFGEETKMGKAMLVAKQLMLMKQLIMDAKSQLSTATTEVGKSVITGAGATTDVSGSIAKASNTAPPPANIPFIISAIATGAGILASVRSAIKGTKKAAASVGASVSTPAIPDPAPPTPTSTPLPPDISSIGQGGVSQLAEAIGTQQPVQAFVVSNDVTTAQGLERNIVDSASIG
jgi:hypothetical protein